MSKFTVSASPHAKSNTTTTGIMLDVIISLVPAFVMSIVYFGTRALALSAVTIGTAVLAEYICRRVMKRPNTLGDLSAIVTGLILALNLPSTLPLWMGAVGSVIAIVVVKQMFGGIGCNFVNPAITARIVLLLSFPSAMSTWVNTFQSGWSADAVTSATPMALLNSTTGGDISSVRDSLPSLVQMLIGNHGGSMGEVCIVALLAGAVYLVLRKVISVAIPLSYIGTVAVFVMLCGHFNWTFVAYELLGGGLILGACFMATDYTTSPLTAKGKIVFGIGCGIITAVIRLFGSMAEGVSFSILLMNIFVPYIEKFTAAKPFGTLREKKEKKEAAS